MNMWMGRGVIIGLCLAVCLAGCTKYTTNTGRRGPEQTPVSTHPLVQSAPQMTFEHAELDSVPALVTPIIKSVWIMPHQTTSGDFVGAYVLHMVIRPGDVVAPSETIVTRPPLPRTEVAPPLLAPPVIQEERSQYELPEDEDDAPYWGQPREHPVYPPASQTQSQAPPTDILIEQATQAAEQLRQQLREADIPPSSGATPSPTLPPAGYPEVAR